MSSSTTQSQQADGSVPLTRKELLREYGALLDRYKPTKKELNRMADLIDLIEATSTMESAI